MCYVLNTYNEILLSHKKEWNNAIYSKVDEPRKTNIIYRLYVESKKTEDTNELIYKTEIDSQHGKQIYGYQRGKGSAEG